MARTKFIYFKIVVVGIVYLIIFNLSYALSQAEVKDTKNIINYNDYQAVVVGKMTKKNVKKSGNYYITEYKLKVKEWLFKQPNIKEAKNLTIKILGAEFLERGIVIKSSTSPDFIPMYTDTIFLLQNNKKPKKNTFTIPKNGVIALGEK